MIVPPILDFAMQPVWRSHDLEIHHFEMLLRERSDAQLHLSILADAESKGFIQIIDFFAVSTAVDLMRKDPYLCLSVNVSSGTIEQVAAEFIARIPDKANIPARLTVELTETRPPIVSRVVEFRRRLSERGIAFSIDDFGPECALSHASLLALQPDEIKLSRRALEVAMHDGDHGYLSVAKMAECRVVAEFIDSQHKLDFARLHGITLVQGNPFDPSHKELAT